MHREAYAEHEPFASGRSLSDRWVEERLVGGPNAHAYWYTVRNHKNGTILGPILIVLFYLIINSLKHLPSLTLKRGICRLLGMKVGKNVTIASGATLDYFFPELIEIGDNTIVGMEAMILTHEFLHDRWRTGKVTIGRNVMVGARSTVLAGVSIGNNVTISAMSLVHKSVPPALFVGGVPIAVIRP
ncbi:MAG: acyltransferase [Luteitalea sp.]|nr:acyltransferase [Luteitalea sp.]